MEIIVSKYHNYCSGVIRAIRIAKETKAKFLNTDVYIFGMLVHNEDVIKDLSSDGIISLSPSENKEIEVLQGLAKGSVVIFTAHGHDKKLEKIASDLGLICVDATCGRVKKNLDLIEEYLAADNEVIYIGKNHHPETMAALSIGNKVFLYEHEKPFDFSVVHSSHPLVVNQTTLSFLELEEIHKSIKSMIPKANIVNEICDETHKRQLAALNLPFDCDLIYVVGSSHSSNTAKLFEIVQNYYIKTKVFNILNVKNIKDSDLKTAKKIGIVSGASTPPIAIKEIENYLNKFKPQ